MPGIPPLLVAKAEEIGFGRVERAFRPTYSTNIISIVMFLGLGAVFVFAAFAVTEPTGILLCLAFAAAALLLTAWAVLDTWRLIRRRFYLCEGGLLLAEHLDRLTRTVAWDEIAEVRRYYLRWYTGGGSQTMHRCRLRLTDGTKLNLEKPPLVDGQELCGEVERRSARARLPRMAAELESAGRLDFGPLTITPEGLYSVGGNAVWSDISLVRLRRVRLRIWTNDAEERISVLVRNVPDLLILLMLVERHGPRMDLRFYRTV